MFSFSLVKSFLTFLYTGTKALLPRRTKAYPLSIVSFKEGKHYKTMMFGYKLSLEIAQGISF